MNITIIVFISLGVLACLIAFIWVKFIKKNNFGYSSKNIQTNAWYKKFLNEIGVDDSNQFKDVILKMDKQYVALGNIIVGAQNIYIISNPLEKAIDTVVCENNDYFVYKKSSKLLLPPDVRIILNQTHSFKKHLKIGDNLQIIIPLQNDLAIQKKNQNVNFVPIKDMVNFYKEAENETNDFDNRSCIDFIKNNQKIKTNKNPFSFFKKK